MMKNSYWKEVKIIMALAIPVMIAQASQSGIMFVDTIMAGHYSATALSGVALGSSIFWPAVLFAQGLLSVLTPIIAHLNGRAQRDQVADHTRQGLLLAVILSALIMFILYHGDKIILFSNQGKSVNTEMLNVAVDFLRAVMWGVPGFLFYLVYRNQCEGLSNTKPAMVAVFTALVVNIPINYVLIYGKLGLPEFGGKGCGIAAAVVFWLLFFILRGYTLMARNQRDIRQTPMKQLFNQEIMKRIIVLGLPLALALFFEISLFAIIAILIAPLGQNAVAGNQIIFTISSMTFTIPLALSVATSIRVGFLLGEQKVAQAKQAAYISLVISLCLAIIVALFLLTFKHYIIGLFTQDILVIEICLQLIILLAIYQCSDYVQITANSVLRGYKDTKSIFIVTFIAYWVIGLPAGYILGLTNLVVPAMGPAGFWIGIIIGLTMSAILLLSRMHWLQNQPIANILKKADR
ncbi:MATE family efflux transporter [Utexia brackfieldae]|uniref:MATE family efflux transporter n=1 Tax=Utexia brackfieldae TaxID=3074108 RepID=UPI00370D3E08